MASKIFYWVDRIFAYLVILGGFGHAAGSMANYPRASELRAYAIGLSFLIWVCGISNLIRGQRPSDRSVACVALLSGIGVIAVTIAWGFAIASLTDPRVIGFVVQAGVLSVFSAIVALRRPVS